MSILSSSRGAALSAVLLFSFTSLAVAETSSGDASEDAEEEDALVIERPLAVECGSSSCLNKEGKLDGLLRFRWPNSKTWKEGRLAAGELSGEWKWLWPNGKTMAVVHYKAGKREGLAQYFYANGKLQAKGNFKNDEPSEKFEYYSFKGAETGTFPLHMDSKQKKELAQLSGKLRDGARSLLNLARQEAPEGLKGAALAAYAEHSEWLTDAATRLETAGISGLGAAGLKVEPDPKIPSPTYADELGAKVAGLPGVGPALVSELSAVTLEFMGLQSRLKNEAREFEELAGPALARHTAALKTLANLL